jgi:hypothetical protein
MKKYKLTITAEIIVGETDTLYVKEKEDFLLAKTIKANQQIKLISRHQKEGGWNNGSTLFRVITPPTEVEGG